jgi:hypothetical protein
MSIGFIILLLALAGLFAHHAYTGFVRKEVTSMLIRGRYCRSELLTKEERPGAFYCEVYGSIVMVLVMLVVVPIMAYRDIEEKRQAAETMNRMFQQHPEMLEPLRKLIERAAGKEDQPASQPSTSGRQETNQ